MIIGFFFIPVNGDLAFSKGIYNVCHCNSIDSLFCVLVCYGMSVKLAIVHFSCSGNRNDRSMLFYHPASGLVGRLCTSLE